MELKGFSWQPIISFVKMFRAAYPECKVSPAMMGSAGIDAMAYGMPGLIFTIDIYLEHQPAIPRSQ